MATNSLHTAAATVVLPAVNVPGYELVPGYTTQLPGAVLYADEFDTDVGGWVSGTASRITRTVFPGTTDMALLIERLSTAGAATATRVFTGLIVGRKYYATARQSIPGASDGRVMQLPSTPGVIAAESGAGGGGYTAVFIATAVTQTVTLAVNGVPAGGAGVYTPGMYVRGFTLTLLASSFYTPPVMQPPTTIPSATVALSVKNTSVTLDDSWSPYAQATLVCYAPSIETLEALDPRKGLRVRVTLTQSWGDANGNWNSFGYRAPVTRTFDLSLRERSVDKKTGEMTLTLASDEGLLLDYALVATAPDSSQFANAVSLRGIVNYALGKVGAALQAGDPDSSYYIDATNLATNPMLGSDATGWSFAAAGGAAATGARTLLSADFPMFYTATFTTAPTGLGSAIRYRTTEPLAVAPGETVSVGMLGWLNWAGASTAAVIRWLNAAGVEVGSTFGPFTAHGSNSVQRREVTGIAPAGTTQAIVDFRHAAGSMPVVGSRLAATSVAITKTPLPVAFFTGSSPSDAAYTYAWTGTPHASTSTRTAANGTSADAFTWNPGVSAWDFLAPLVQQAGYRLWCDEARVWRLATAWNTQTQINVSGDSGLTAGVDLISRNEAWYDSVVIEYRWTDRDGRQQTRYDIAGVPGNSTLTIRYTDTPFPGAGAAASVLRRADGKGRIIAPESINNYLATPGMVLQISLPESPVQTGMLSNVTWNLPEDVMQVGSRGLTDTPASAWINALGTWATATGTWATATGTN